MRITFFVTFFVVLIFICKGGPLVNELLGDWTPISCTSSLFAYSPVLRQDIFWTPRTISSVEVCVNFTAPVTECGLSKDSFIQLNIDLVRKTEVLKLDIPPSAFKLRLFCHVFEACDIAKKCAGSDFTVRIQVGANALIYADAKNPGETVPKFQTSLRSVVYPVSSQETIKTFVDRHKLHEILCRLPDCIVSSPSNIEPKTYRFTLMGNNAPRCEEEADKITSGMFSLTSYRWGYSIPSRIEVIDPKGVMPDSTPSKLLPPIVPATTAITVKSSAFHLVSIGSIQAVAILTLMTSYR